ncbi:conserved hypothetical protein [Microcystis sp. T1-4]|nr:conserved hypothetical protein [Microcystis sp. T1-4]
MSSESIQFIAKQSLKSYGSYLHGEVESFRFGESVVRSQQ